MIENVQWMWMCVLRRTQKSHAERKINNSVLSHIDMTKRKRHAKKKKDKIREAILYQLQ